MAVAYLKRMHEILNSYQKESNIAFKKVMSNCVVSIVKRICQHLLKYHSNAYERAKEAHLTIKQQSFIIVGIFTYENNYSSSS